MRLCPLGPRSGITSAAGLLTCGSTLFGAFPYRFTGTVAGSRHAEELPCRNLTGFPILPDPVLAFGQRPDGDTARYSVSAGKIMS